MRGDFTTCVFDMIGLESSLGAGIPSGEMSTRLPGPARRTQLLAVALQVFAEQGYHHTSMNQVAEAAGVTKPVLYQHFRSKKALYRELLEEVSSRLEESIAKATAEARSPREQVHAGLSTYFRFITENRAAFTVLFGGGTARDGEFAESTRRVEQAITEAIPPLMEVDGLDADARRLLAHGIVGLTEGTTRHWVASGYRPDAEELAARTAQLAWAGLRGVRANP